MQSFELKVAKRKELSKKARRIAVDDGFVLGNIFGDGDSVAVQAPYRMVYELVKAAGKNHPVKIDIEGGDTRDVLIRDVERDTLTQRIHHITFRVIKAGEKIRVLVPIRLEGEAPGIKAGLVLLQVVNELEVATLPSKIPEEFSVDVTGLEEDGDSVHIEDLEIGEDVEVVTDENLLLAKVEIPRAQLVEEEEPEEDEEGEEGEDGDEGEEDGEGTKESKESAESEELKNEGLKRNNEF